MNGLVAPSYGPLSQLVVADLPLPEPRPGQILVRVEAAALNPQDIRLITGEVREMMSVEHPFVPGMDAAGVVEGVGDGVTQFVPGDEVLAFTYGTAGAIAEYTLVAEGPSVARRPPELDAVRGAGLPVAGLTAASLLEVAQLQVENTVLVVGATGGVGCFVVQMAAQAGAEVIATARPEDVDLMRRLGARESIDHTSTDTTEEALRREPGGVDVVVDLVNAGPGLAFTARAAKRGGRLVNPHGGPPEFNGVTAVYGHVAAKDGLLQNLADRAAAGTLMVEVGTTYAFADVQRAITDFADEHHRGKVVIRF